MEQLTALIRFLSENCIITLNPIRQKGKVYYALMVGCQYVFEPTIEDKIKKELLQRLRTAQAEVEVIGTQEDSKKLREINEGLIFYSLLNQLEIYGKETTRSV